MALDKRGRFQGVTAFVGMPGSGKTYALAEIGLEAMKQGKRVVCNAGFDLDGAEVLQTFDDFARLEGPVVVCWDELPLYFNARKWSEFPDSMLYKFTQIRKDGVQLYYSAISEEMVDVTIRRITFWYWHCASVSDRLLVRSKYPPHEFRKAGGRRMARKWTWVREEVAAAYDTDRKVAIPQKVRERLQSGVPELVRWDGSPLAEGAGALRAEAPGQGGANGGVGEALGASWAAGDGKVRRFQAR